jgi:hypothetical protein
MANGMAKRRSTFGALSDRHRINGPAAITTINIKATEPAAGLK